MASSDDSPGRAKDVANLARLSLFGALSSETIEFLASRCDEVEVAAGEPFFSQGESGDCLFVLRAGRAAVERTAGERRVTLAELVPGSCFGEVALVAIRPRTATVRALEDSVALRLPHRVIYELSQRDTEQFALLQMNLAREVGRRLDEADRELARRTQPGPVPRDEP